MLKKKYILPKTKKTQNFLKSENTKFFLIKYKENNFDFCRFAVVVPKKLVKKAVERNKIKRQVKAILKDYVKIGNYDFLIFLKNKSNFAGFKEDLEEFFKKFEHGKNF